MQGGRRGSRTLKAHRSAAFEAAAIANWLALPFIKAAVAGIEPASCAVNSRLPVPARAPPHHASVRTAGFEPAISCSRSTRNTRLSHVLIIKSAQRESNPHFRHGKAAGCRYIMGALW